MQSLAEILIDCFDRRTLPQRLARSGDAEIKEERDRAAARGQSGEDGFRLAHLWLAQPGRNGTEVGVQLRRADFVRGVLGGGFLLRFEISPDADAVEGSLNAPRADATAVLGAADNEHGLFYP